MNATRTIAVVAAVAALSLPGQAAAARPLPGQAVAQRIAVAAFGAPPCGVVTIEVAPLESWTWGDDTSTAEAYQADCRIRFAPSVYEWHPEEVCQTMTHEYGHLNGLGHSTDPQSVMYPDLSVNRFAPCAAATREGWRILGRAHHLREAVHARRRGARARMSRFLHAVDPAELAYARAIDEAFGRIMP